MLKKYSLAEEGSCYITEVVYENGTVWFYLKDYYNNTINVYRYQWLDVENLPASLAKNRKNVKYVVIGKQHIMPRNEESYFSRW